MRVIGVLHPGASPILDLTIGHGQNPQQLIWRRGYVVRSWLSALIVDREIVMTAIISPRTHRSRPPRLKKRDRKLVMDAEAPVLNQRIAAYAVVLSKRGVLGTECSDKTAVPGLWQLPGGGVNPGETPAQAVLREMAEETGQEIKFDHLVELQSDRWIGRARNGRVEDFHALRIIYTATCANPTTPTVVDIDGTTSRAAWIPIRRWRALPWTSGARSVLDKYLDKIRL